MATGGQSSSLEDSMSSGEQNQSLDDSLSTSGSSQSEAEVEVADPAPPPPLPVQLSALAEKWLMDNPMFERSDFIGDLIEDQDALEPFVIIVEPGSAPNKANRVSQHNDETYYVGRTIAGVWIRLEMSEEAEAHAEFIWDKLAVFKGIISNPENCACYKLKAIASRLPQFRIDLMTHMKKKTTSVLDALPAVLELTNFCKRFIALGDVRLHRFSQFPGHRMGITNAVSQTFGIIPEQGVDDNHEDEPCSDATVDSKVEDTLNIVHECAAILQVILSTDERFSNAETRFNLFKQLFLPSICTTLPTAAATYKFSDLFNADEWEKNRDLDLVHPISCENLIKLITSSMLWFVEFFELNRPPPIEPEMGFTPGDRIAFIHDALNIAIMVLEQHYVPDINLQLSFYGSDSKIHTTPSFEAATLFTVCLRFSPWIGPDSKEHLHELGKIMDNMIEADLKHGNIPTASLTPFDAFVEMGLVSKTTVPFAFQPVTLTEMNKYASELCYRMSIKLKRPLKHFLLDYKLPPHFAMVYALVTILERFAEEAGDPAVYVYYAESEMLTKGFEILGELMLQHPTSFLGALQSLIDIAITMVNRLVSRRYQGEIFANSSKDHPVCHSGFYMSLYAVQSGIRSLEATVRTDPDVANTFVYVLVSGLLELGKNLDRVAHPQLKSVWIDIISEIGPAIAELMPEWQLRDIVKKLLGCRFDPIAPKRYNPVEVAAKAGRAIGKLLRIPQLHLNPKLISLIFNDGFINLDLKATAAGQPASVRNQWAWALAELAQGLEYSVEVIGFIPSNDYLHTMLRYVTMVSEGPFKSRYNGFRAAGNLLAVVRPADGNPKETREKNTIFGICSSLIKTLLLQLGEGLEYKNRWNAAYGLGCIFSNEELLDHLRTVINTKGTSTLLNQVIYSLANWVSKSQNYKERIQCLVALAKIPSRKELGGNLKMVLTRICQSIASYPTEENEMKEKFDIEVVITMSTVIVLAEPADFEMIETALTPWMDSLRILFSNVSPKVVGQRVDVAIKGRDRLNALRRHAVGSKLNLIIQSIIDFLTDFIGDEESEILENVVDSEPEDLERFNMLNLD